MDPRPPRFPPRRQTHESKPLRVRGVTRYFGDQQVLSDIHMSIDANEITAVLGPNGAGKTTLLRILTGLARPSTGTVDVLGAAPDQLRRRDAGAVGFVPSGDRTFYRRLSGRENLRFVARMYGFGRVEATRRADALLDAVGLGDAATRRVDRYSQGMHKRLSVARGLLTDPAVLLIDEATHDLDPSGALQIRTLVSDAAGRGTAVLWATQHLDELPGFADSVVVLDGGMVRHQGSIDDLLAHAPRRRYVLTLARHDPDVDLVAAVAGLERAERLDGVPCRVLVHLADDAVLSDVICAISRTGGAVLACREEQSEMLEAFLSLVGGGAR